MTKKPLVDSSSWLEGENPLPRWSFAAPYTEGVLLAFYRYTGRVPKEVSEWYNTPEGEAAVETFKRDYAQTEEEVK
jgi:hypothetical protein